LKQLNIEQTSTKFIIEVCLVILPANLILTPVRPVPGFY